MRINYTYSDTQPKENLFFSLENAYAKTGVVKNLYEKDNHLGNVLTVVSDRKIAHSSNSTDIDYYLADILSTTDYYAFGAPMPGRTFNTNSYRYNFNGKESDQETVGTGGGTQDYGFRIYNPSLGRFLSVDPLSKKYPMYTPYSFAGNTPISSIDVEGLEESLQIHAKITRGDITEDVDWFVTKDDINDKTIGYYAEVMGISADYLWANIPEEGGVSLNIVVVDGVVKGIRTTNLPLVEVSEDRYGFFETVTMAIEQNGPRAGEEGLKGYSDGLTKTGLALEATPLAPVGGLLTVASDIIDTGLDFKNKPAKEAFYNLGVRLATFSLGKLFNKGSEKVREQLPKTLGDQTTGEKVVEYGVEVGLEAVENAAVIDDKEK